MLIDWFTVGAQTLNFIILVWLMKRFLYQPILNAIDAREKRIADELARADKISQEANQAKASFESKNLEFDQQRNQLLVDATEAANSERQHLLEVARQSADELEQKQQIALQNKMQNLHHSILTATQKELFSMAKNALRDLAEVDIETQIVAIFLKQLSAMNSEQLNAMQSALKAQQICVQSSKALSPEQQGSIEKTLHEIIGKDIQLQFELSTDLIGGIELSANGFKTGWSLAEYLHTLEASLVEQVNKHIIPPGSTQSKNAAVNEHTKLAADINTSAQPSRSVIKPALELESEVEPEAEPEADAGSSKKS
tara:strand:+ start:47042 stop:47977 length:936 start_codon:yes stop_codon:yes gene_type:complete